MNLFMSELLYRTPAQRVTPKLHQLAVTDAKSLYDCVISDSPNLTEERSLVNVQAIQEVVSGDRFYWVPTHLMWADGLPKHSKELQQTLHSWLQAPLITSKGAAHKWAKKKFLPLKIWHIHSPSSVASLAAPFTHRGPLELRSFFARQREVHGPLALPGLLSSTAELCQRHAQRICSKWAR